MRYLMALFILLSATVYAGETAPPTLDGGWNLVWNDEFDGAKIDLTKWKPEIGIVRNENAAQVYTDDEKNLRLKNGMLEITARYAPKTPCPTYNPDAAKKNWINERQEVDYTSASLNSSSTFNFLFGRVEIRAKVPAGKGVWPAVWTLGKNKWGWPHNAEIDILEHISNEPKTAYAIFRWGEPDGPKEVKVVRTTKFEPNLAAAFHLYVMEWDEKMMRILIDGKEIGKINLAQANYKDGENPLRTPHYLIVNLALGGWAEKPQPKDYPTTFFVDYIRFYQKPEHQAAAKKYDAKTGKLLPPPSE